MISCYLLQKKVQYRLIQGALFGNIPDPQELEYLIATELASIKNVSERIHDQTEFSFSAIRFEQLWILVCALHKAQETLKRYSDPESLANTAREITEINGHIFDETTLMKVLLSNQAVSKVYAKTLAENLRPILESFREDASSLENNVRILAHAIPSLYKALKAAYYNAVSYVEEQGITLSALDEISEASSMKQLQKMLPGRDVPSILRSLGSKSYVQLLEFLNSFEIPKNAICTMDDLVRISDSRYNTLDFVAFLKGQRVQAWFLTTLCQHTGISPGLLMKTFHEYQLDQEYKSIEPVSHTLYKAALGRENLTLDQRRKITELCTKLFPDEVSWRSAERPFFIEEEEAQVVPVEPELQPQPQPQPDNHEVSSRRLGFYGLLCAGVVLPIAVAFLLPIVSAFFSNEQNLNPNQRLIVC